MKIKLEVGIYGQPAKLNLSAKISYGKGEQFEKKVFHKKFSLDSGGTVVLPIPYFSEYAKVNNLEID